jgi:hypothetical protein
MVKKILIFVGLILLGVIGVFAYQIATTKSHSPFETIKYQNTDTQINIEYCRPYKKERQIFGELVPFDKIWRTGANEATVIRTNKDLKFGEHILNAGTYTLWTIPHKDTWSIILNKEIGQWGVKMGGVANCDISKNIFQFDVPSSQVAETEMLTMEMKEISQASVELFIRWDKTQVKIPFEIL